MEHHRKMNDSLLKAILLWTDGNPLVIKELLHQVDFETSVVVNTADNWEYDSKRLLREAVDSFVWGVREYSILICVTAIMAYRTMKNNGEEPSLKKAAVYHIAKEIPSQVWEHCIEPGRQYLCENFVFLFGNFLGRRFLSENPHLLFNATIEKYAHLIDRELFGIRASEHQKSLLETCLNA